MREVNFGTNIECYMTCNDLNSPKDGCIFTIKSLLFWARPRGFAGRKSLLNEDFRSKLTLIYGLIT